MHTLSSHRRPARAVHFLSLAAIATSVMFAACAPSDVGKAKLKGIPKGAKREAVLAAMGTGPLAPITPADQPRIVNGFRHNVYIWNFKTYEILWYRDTPGTLADPIVQKTETPVVLEGDTLVGWGWKFYSPYAAKQNLPDPSHDRARADSIVKAQNPDTGKKP